MLDKLFKKFKKEEKTESPREILTNQYETLVEKKINIGEYGKEEEKKPIIPIELRNYTLDGSLGFIVRYDEGENFFVLDCAANRIGDDIIRRNCDILDRRFSGLRFYKNKESAAMKIALLVGIDLIGMGVNLKKINITASNSDLVLGVNNAKSKSVPQASPRFFLNSLLDNVSSEIKDKNFVKYLEDYLNSINVKVSIKASGNE